jgi:hypothetical protein
MTGEEHMSGTETDMISAFRKSLPGGHCSGSACCRHPRLFVRRFVDDPKVFAAFHNDREWA